MGAAAARSPHGVVLPSGKGVGEQSTVKTENKVSRSPGRF